MEEQLQINMLGGFSLQYKDHMIDYSQSRSHKLWLILEYLIAFRGEAVTQEELIQVLWKNETADNPENTLKTLLHRLRAMLDELEYMPSKKMVIYNRGMYRWNTDLNYVVDVDQFSNFVMLGDDEENPEQKLVYYLDAIEYYKGDFLPKSAQEQWVIPMNARYHAEYIRVVRECVEMMKQEERYYDVISLCQSAIAIDPYDENLHYELLQAMLVTGAKQAAMMHYEKVVDLFYNEFGLNLSERMTDLYKELIKTNNDIEVDLSVIRDKLQEPSTNPGAFYCEYSLFKEIYHLQSRTAGRSGQSIYLCMMSVTDGNNNALDKKKNQNAAVSQLHYAIQTSLRQGDVFTRYSVSQFLILLPAINFENCEMVLKRIQRNFKKENPHSKAVITYKLQALRVKVD